MDRKKAKAFGSFYWRDLLLHIRVWKSFLISCFHHGFFISIPEEDSSLMKNSVYPCSLPPPTIAELMMMMTLNKKSSHTGSRYLLNLSVVVSDTKTLFKRHSGLKIIPSSILHGSRISLKRFRKRGESKRGWKCI